MSKKEKYVMLTNGCYRTAISVTPQNWNTQKATTKKPWLIWYRFYDPSSQKRSKLVRIAGMNTFNHPDHRRQQTQALIEAEKDLIDVKGYNPITESFMKSESPNDFSQKSTVTTLTSAAPNSISKTTGFINALDFSFEQLKVVPRTLKGIQLVLSKAWHAAENLKITDKPISEINKADIRLLLNEMGNIIGDTWTNNNFNHHRKYLSILLSNLEEFAVLDSNPVTGIKKRKHAAAPKRILTLEECEKIDAQLYENNYRFWRIMQLFYESGCRETEFLAVQRDHVDWPNRRFRIKILKGANYNWNWKPINQEVAYLWEEILKYADGLSGTGPLFMFSVDLIPRYRATPILPEQLTRRWDRWVKKRIGITVGFYELKHLKTTRTTNALVKQGLTVEAAHSAVAENTGHTTPVMLRTVYDVDYKTRDLEIKKSVRAGFATGKF